MLTPPRDGGHLCKMHFGCKAHIDMDKESGPAYTVKVTAADIHDVAAPCGLLIGGKKRPAETAVIFAQTSGPNG